MALLNKQQQQQKTTTTKTQINNNKKQKHNLSTLSLRTTLHTTNVVLVSAQPPYFLVCHLVYRHTQHYYWTCFGAA